MELEVHTLWVALGVIILAVAALLYLATPKEQFGPHAQEGGFGFGPEAVQDRFLESSVISLRN